MNSLFHFAHTCNVCFTSSNVIVSTHEVFSLFWFSCSSQQETLSKWGWLGLNQTFGHPKYPSQNQAQPLSRFSQGKSGKSSLEPTCFANLPGGCFSPPLFSPLHDLLPQLFPHEEQLLVTVRPAVVLLLWCQQCCRTLRLVLYFPCCSAHFRLHPSCCSPKSVSLVLWEVLFSLAGECTLVLCPNGKNRGIEMELFLPLPSFSSPLCKGKTENVLFGCLNYLLKFYAAATTTV